MLLKIILIHLSLANASSQKGKDSKMRQRANHLGKGRPIIPQDSGSQTLICIRELCGEPMTTQIPGPAHMDLSLAELL